MQIQTKIEAYHGQSVNNGVFRKPSPRSVIATWRQDADDHESVCHFFVSIWKSLKRSHTEGRATCGWHELFSQQAELYLHAKPEERKYIQRSVDLGRRRFVPFMAPEPHLAPGYGLCSFDNSLQLLEPDDQIKAIREMARKYHLEIDLHGGFLAYQNEGAHGSCAEIASVFPYRLPNGVEIQRRWTSPITVSRAEDREAAARLRYLIPIKGSKPMGRYLFDSEDAVKQTIDLMVSTGELCGILPAETFTNLEGGPVKT